MSELEARSLEDQAGDTPLDDSEDDGSGQFTIPGTFKGLSLNAGGKKPQTAEMKMNAVSLPVVGQFDNGDTVWVAVQVEVTQVHFVHEKKGRETIGSIRRHKAVPIQVRVMDPPDLDDEDNVDP